MKGAGGSEDEAGSEDLGFFTVLLLEGAIVVRPSGECNLIDVVGVHRVRVSVDEEVPGEDRTKRCDATSQRLKNVKLREEDKL